VAHILEGEMPETSKSNFEKRVTEGVRPELVAEVKYLSWTGDNLLRQGLHEDKPAVEVRRPVPHPKSGAQTRTVTAKKPVARSQGVPSKP
jgi:ATP-dependent DNA ligase